MHQTYAYSIPLYQSLWDTSIKRKCHLSCHCLGTGLDTCLTLLVSLCALFGSVLNADFTLTKTRTIRLGSLNLTEDSILTQLAEPLPLFDSSPQTR
jgi:hypothetical protein